MKRQEMMQFLKSCIIKELYRRENEEDKSIFVKNIENAQGDERDIIIFSIGYAPDENGRLRFNFGDLPKEDGENKLNVTASRAKKKTYLITSIELEDLRVENSKNKGPKLLKEYLKYVGAISNGNENEAREILYALSGISSNSKSKCESLFDSIFEEEVSEKLESSSVIVENSLEL